MSYLGFPRLHFAGAFFANPGNLNNTVVNYTNASRGLPLVYDTGPYNNPNGVAQFYFYACKVTQLIGADAQLITSDPVLGAPIDTASPANPAATFAKIVDLDPDMQFRTELYGLRLYLEATGGFGFTASVEVPQLRDLYFSRGNAGIAGLQIACGTWHQRVHVEKWANPGGKSAFLSLLSANGATELDMKLTVDMFQTDPRRQESSPIDYCYGRLMGTIGPVTTGMPKQIVPGRRLYPAGRGAESAATVVGASKGATRQAAALAASQASGTPAWNNTDAMILQAAGSSYLVVDLGTTTPLTLAGQGALDFGPSLVLGYVDASGKFVAFETQGYTAGSKVVSLNDQLVALAPPEAVKEHCDAVYYANAAVVQLSLTPAEVSALTRLPLCIRTNKASMLEENPSGYYVNFEAATCRMSPKETLASGLGAVNLVAYQFGQPVPSLTQLSTSAASPTSGLGVRLTPQLYVYSGLNDDPTATPTPLFTASVATEPLGGCPGQFRMTLATGASQPVSGYPVRQPLDSLLCSVECTTSPPGYVAENGGDNIPPIALLFWQNWAVVSAPTWQANIGPILTEYARLYPGMAGILDLADQPTVLANANAIAGRMSLPVTDPAYMPVVRDMSPATTAMITTWLKQQISKPASGGQQ